MSCTYEATQEHQVNADVPKEECVGGGSRAPVTIMILVKNPSVTHDGCQIQYRDIGDYLTREEKLEALRESVSIKGISNWQAITPDRHYDWVEQRSEAFALFYPLGSQESRAGDSDNAILGYILKE